MSKIQIDDLLDYAFNKLTKEQEQAVELHLENNEIDNTLLEGIFKFAIKLYHL